MAVNCPVTGGPHRVEFIATETPGVEVMRCLDCGEVPPVTITRRPKETKEAMPTCP